jgi:hypothetical protein
VRRLKADRAHRVSRRTLFVEGVRKVVHAIRSGFRIEALVYSKKLLIVHIARRLVRDRCRSGTPTLHFSTKEFRQVSTTPRACGMRAIVARRWSPLHGASPRPAQPAAVGGVSSQVGRTRQAALTVRELSDIHARTAGR